MDLEQYLWWSYGHPNVGSKRDGALGLKSIPVSLNDKTEEVQWVFKRKFQMNKHLQLTIPNLCADTRKVTDGARDSERAQEEIRFDRRNFMLSFTPYDDIMRTGEEVGKQSHCLTVFCSLRVALSNKKDRTEKS